MTEDVARADSGLLAIGGHPIYSAILPMPILAFTAALVTDIVYALSPDMMWLDFSSWLLLGGLIVGAVAGVLLIVEVVRAGRRRTGALLAHLGLLFAAWVVEVFNSFFHTRDGWTGVVPGGLLLSILAVALALVSGWFWQAFAHGDAHRAAYGAAGAGSSL